MDSFNLEPTYTTGEIPGKCIRCLAEEELNTCLRAILRGDSDDEEMVKRYEALVAFLQSEDSLKLRRDSENLLSEGKKVYLIVSVENGEYKYTLEVE
jgi:hypothetical protein